jgi:hypothetical protein
MNAVAAVLTAHTSSGNPCHGGFLHRRNVRGAFPARSGGEGGSWNVCICCVQVVGDGRCPIVDTWWQTETGAHMITPLPGATTLKPGSATLPFFGVEPAILNEKGEEIEGEGEGWAGPLFSGAACCHALHVRAGRLHTHCQWRCAQSEEDMPLPQVLGDKEGLAVIHAHAQRRPRTL